ncbi:MAG: IS1595 family transposase [Pseudomonadota bacterium]
MIDLQNPIYNDDNKAREHLENLRWAQGAVCPHCGTVGNSTLMKGKSTRPGVHKCKDCRKPFSVTVGTLFERSHISLSKWLLAVHLLSSSKKGMSSHQLHRMLGVTYKTAWFMSHRIREAMKPINPSPLGGEGRTVEADETYVGGLEKNKHKKDRLKAGRGPVGKEAVFSLVERGGKVRSTHVPAVNAQTLRPIMNEQLHADTRLITDDASVYGPIGKDFSEHHSVAHSIGEYVRGDTYTNTIENYFSIFKRGIKGVYQHCSKEHLKRYLAEFDFRYNSRDIEDWERANAALKGIEGKRLTYRRIDQH